jgi:hypothetical protein
MLNKKREYIYTYDYKNRLIKIEKNITKKPKNKKETIQKQKIVEMHYDIL